MSVEHLWYSRHVFHAAAAKGMHQRERSAAAAAAGMAIAAVPPAEGGGEPAEDTEVPPEVPQTLAVEATADQEEEGGDDEASRAELSSFTVSGPAAAALLACTARRRGTPAWRAFSPHAKLLAISALCNRARPTKDAEPPPVPMAGVAERAITGSAADAALFRYAEMFFAVASARAQFPRVFDVPFASATKFAATVVSDRADPSGRHIVMFKGAPEVILARCATWVFGREERNIDDEFREQARRRRAATMHFCKIVFRIRLFPDARIRRLRPLLNGIAAASSRTRTSALAPWASACWALLMRWCQPLAPRCTASRSASPPLAACSWA
jgi:hypothetical protein